MARLHPWITELEQKKDLKAVSWWEWTFLLLEGARILETGLWPSLYSLYDAYIQKCALVNVPETTETEIMSTPRRINKMWLDYINEKSYKQQSLICWTLLNVFINLSRVSLEGRRFTHSSL